MRPFSWILCASLLAAVEALAAPAKVPAGGVIHQEPRLQSRVTLRVRDFPLSDLVADVGKRTGVKLRTTRLTGDDKVTLFVKDRPAGEILARIASHFDFQWTRDGQAYELGQSLAAQNRERKLREEELARQLRTIQDHMNRLQGLLQTPRERLEARQKELMAQLRDPQAAGNRAMLGVEMGMLQEVLAPGAAASLSLYRQLNAVQIAQLTATGQLRLSTESGTLSPLLAEQIHQAASQMLKSAQVIRFGDGPPGPGPENEPPVGATVVVALEDGYRPAPARQARLARGLSLRFVLTSLRGEAGRRNALPVVWGPRVPSPEAEAPGATVTNDPDLKQEIELAKGEGPGAPPAPGLPLGAVLLSGGASAAPGLTPLSRILEQVHEQTGLEILADSFIRGRLHAADLAAKRPVVQLLDSVRDFLEYDWEKEGRLLRLRNSRFYHDRPHEIPVRVVKPWRDQLTKTGLLALDDLAAMMASISDPQAQSLQSFWAWYLEVPGITPPEPPMGLYDNRYHLRFWATLSAPQRLTARREILPVGGMNFGQRNAFALALASRSSLMMRPGDQEKAAAPAELAAGGFTLKSTQSTLRSMSGQGPSGNRIALRIQEDGARGGPPRTPSVPEGGDIQIDSVRTTTLDSYNFHYHLSGDPKPARVASIQVPRPAARTEQR